jgi:hypothetical protein
MPHLFPSYSPYTIEDRDGKIVMGVNGIEPESNSKRAKRVVNAFWHSVKGVKDGEDPVAYNNQIIKDLGLVYIDPDYRPTDEDQGMILNRLSDEIRQARGVSKSQVSHRDGAWTDRVVNHPGNTHTSLAKGTRMVDASTGEYVGNYGSKGFESSVTSRYRKKGDTPIPTTKRKHTKSVIYESPAQHKYARFSDAAYHFDDSQGRIKILNNDATRDYMLDKTLSSPNHTIFHNPANGETVVSFRGTSNMADWGTDANLVIGAERQNKRYVEEDQTMRAVIAKYGKGHLAVTGHSLGGGLATTMGERYDVESYSFNPGLSVNNQFGDQLSKTYDDNKSVAHIYRTQDDLVSVGTYFKPSNAHGRDYVLVKSNPAIVNVPVLSAHKMTNFYDDRAVYDMDKGAYKVDYKNDTLATTIGTHVEGGVVDAMLPPGASAVASLAGMLLPHVMQTFNKKKAN